MAPCGQGEHEGAEVDLARQRPDTGDAGMFRNDPGTQHMARQGVARDQWVTQAPVARGDARGALRGLDVR